MDKFLEIVFLNYADSTEADRSIEKHFEPLMAYLKEQVSQKIYKEIEDILSDCATNSSRYYAVEGMKLAIGVMNGTYVPDI